MRCNKCDKNRKEKDFRIKKNHGNDNYRVKTCIFCEREQKALAEKKRYNNFTPEQKEKHNKICRKNSHKESYKNWRREWQREREETDIKFRLKRRISSLMRNSIFKNSNKVQDILGYSIEELREHLEGQFEDWMNWGNWGVYDPGVWDDKDPGTWVWHIDHIRPISSYNYESVDDEEFKECWGLGNLRPLSAKENLSKGANI